jgi:hypothetical protein
MLIAMIDVRLQQVMGNTQSFGGVAILFVGDSNQLGPVQKTFLPQDMMEWANYQKQQDDELIREQSSTTAAVTPIAASGNTPTMIPPSQTTTPHTNGVPKMTSVTQIKKAMKRRAIKRAKVSSTNTKKKGICRFTRYSVKGLVHRGCKLFSQIERYHLATQQRSRNDPQHSNFLKSMSDGVPITLQDIQRYIPLTRDDIEHKPEEWKLAPILVLTNKERMNIIQRQSILFAKENNTFVFKWKTRIKGWKN